MTDIPIPSDQSPRASPLLMSQGMHQPPDSPIEFERLLRGVLAPALGTAMNLTRNRQDAEDLVQETALLAFRAFTSFQPGTNFKAWFFRILVNRFYTTQRRRRAESSLDELEELQPLYIYGRAEALGLLEQPSDPVRLVLGRLAREDIVRAVEQLPDEYRMVCSLYFMEDFSYQEIAEMVAVPIGTVRSRLHRGRRLLQKLLWTVAEDQGIVPRDTQGSAGGAS